MRSDAGFADLGERVWLNSAHQGMLPLEAAERAREAVGWKTHPYEMTQERFDEGPRRLRAALARLLSAPAEEVVLANSASYGLNLIASAYPWREGDEVVVFARDFPSDILPWLNAERRFGIRVVRLDPEGQVVGPDDLRAALTPRTRLFCTTWVHSFSGVAADIEALGTICREAGVVFVANGAQAVGARPADVTRLPVDALTGVGFKWLCGPYGTGYCWLSPELMDRLARTKAYWLSMLTAADLKGDIGELRVGPVRSAADFDIFGTANFFNFSAFEAAIGHLLETGIGTVEGRDQALVQRLIDGLEGSEFAITSPREAGPRRSTLVFLRHPEAEANRRAHERLTEAGISTSLRGGSLRVAPHLYNDEADIDAALDVLGEVA